MALGDEILGDSILGDTVFVVDGGGAAADTISYSVELTARAYMPSITSVRRPEAL